MTNRTAYAVILGNINEAGMTDTDPIVILNTFYAKEALDKAMQIAAEGKADEYYIEEYTADEDGLFVAGSDYDDIQNFIKRNSGTGKYRVKEGCGDRFYGGTADYDYIEECQKNGIPQEDIDSMVREYGYEVYDLLEEI